MMRLTAVLLGALLLSTSLAGSALASSKLALEPAAAGPRIVIENFGYTGDLTVQPGQHVSVVNDDSVNHTLTDKKTQLFNTGTIAPNGGTGSFTAPKKAGRYPFGCNFHPDMAGTLVVKAPVPATSLAAPRSAAIHAGTTRRLVATLTDKVTRRAIGSVRVIMYARTGTHGAFAVLHKLTTSSHGTVSATVRPHSTSQYRWRFAGTSGHRSATSAVTTITVRK